MNDKRMSYILITTLFFTTHSYAALPPETINPDINGGKILIYSTDGEYIDSANVGNLPDMVTFTPDGKRILSANEGEPSTDYKIDPKGSISIIHLTGKKVQRVKTLSFDDIPLPADIRIKPGANPANDLEPEYITINKAGTKAWVSLQENNAFAIIDLVQERIESVVSLGIKDFDSIDINTQDGANVAPAPANIFGLFQPDTISSYTLNGKDYVVTANEGEYRDFGDYVDYAKGSLLLKKGAKFSRQLQDDILNIQGRRELHVLKDLGMDADGTYTSLYLAGTRSFSIRDSNGKLIYDSGADFEQKLALQYPQNFNTRVAKTDNKKKIKKLQKHSSPYETIGETAFFWEGVDARSHKKGCEPEALALAEIGNRVFAYIGLEKQGGFFIYEISDPQNPTMVDYQNDIDYTVSPISSGDLEPEGMVTFSQDSNHYLAIANELSSTVSIYQLDKNGKAKQLASLQTGTFAGGAAEIIAYDPGTKKLFVSNGESKTVDTIDVSNPAKPTKSTVIDFSAHGSSLQSVAVKNGLVAIAVE